MLFERRDFQRRAALAGDEEQRALGDERVGGVADGAFVGRVEDRQRERRGADRRRVAQDLGAQAAAAHAEQVHVVEVRRPDVAGEVSEVCERRWRRVWRVEPAETVTDGVVDAGGSVRRARRPWSRDARCGRPRGRR